MRPRRQVTHLAADSRLNVIVQRSEPHGMIREEANHTLSEPENDSEETHLQLTEEQVLEALRRGVMAEQGLLPYSSNHSFLITVDDDDLSLPAVYKPQHGESPLWDFEWGTLCKRETAAYMLSAALGWDLVPPTVLRRGTRGLGSVQFYVDNDTDAHYFTVQSDARFALSFRQLALYDYMINNADRKSGHCLVGSDDRIWAIDHGICFHEEFKLRTVIWEFSEQTVEAELRADMERIYLRLLDADDDLASALADLLSGNEYAALVKRTGQLVQTKRYPAPSPFRRNYPWPPI